MDITGSSAVWTSLPLTSSIPIDVPVDPCQLRPDAGLTEQLGFFNRWLEYLGFLVTALPGPAGCQQFLHGRSRLSATGVIQPLASTASVRPLGHSRQRGKPSNCVNRGGVHEESKAPIVTGVWSRGFDSLQSVV
jgi:hypothetical protein